MSMHPEARVGFCCKWLGPDGVSDPEMNQSGTTIKALAAKDGDARRARIAEIVQRNCEVLRRQLSWLAGQPRGMRLFRIGSEFVPAATYEAFGAVTADPQLRGILERGLGWVRPFADAHGIRLCTHPGQFTNLCSPRDDVVAGSLADLEHQADLATLMGYGDGWHPSGYAVNVHGNVRQDPGLRRFREAVLHRLSPAARNLVTLENDEFSCGVNDLVASGIGEDVALVLDVHHHWIASRGEYLLPSDPRVAAFRDSWRGVRPLSHVSVSDEAVVAPWPADVLPDYAELAGRGLKPSALRAHGGPMWNAAVVDWAASHLSWTDLEVEAKDKNLASASFLARALAGGAAATAA